MNSLLHFIWHDGQLFGHVLTTEMVVWNIIGFSGQIVFGCRFIVQWFASEKKKQVVVPLAFWWLSLIGSLMIMLYAVFYDKHWVFLIATMFSWIPYVRGLMLHHRHAAAHKDCAGCGQKIPPQANYCPNCGVKVV